MTQILFRCALLASASAIVAAPAFGQATPEPAPAAPVAAPEAPAQNGGLEEIVVTAQRRSENMQNVPIAVTAITATAATQLGITQPESIAQIVPGLALNRSSQAVTPFLRGVGTNSSTIGNEPSVAMFVDDVYIPTGTASVFEFNNISAIEVLKGPQGTLFGRNATGGVIHIRTKNPTFDPTLSVTGSYGNYDTISGQAYASTGITDKIAVNIAGYYSHQNHGWGTNIVTGNDAYASKSGGVRGKLLFNVDDKTSLLLSANYDYRKSNQGQANRVVPGTFTRGGYSPDAAGAGFYDTTTDIDSFYRNKFQQYSGKLKHDFDAFSVVAITAYGKVQGAPSNLDIDASPSPFFNAFTAQGSKTFTQELQVLSPDGSPVKWILGGFYLHDRSFFDADFRGTAFGTARALSHAVQKTSSISGFAQASTEILPQTNMTIGLRYTSDRRSFDAVAGLVPTTGSAVVYGPFADKKTFDSVTGRFSIDHKFGDRVMGYIAYNRGFKSGVYNIAGVTVGTTAVPKPVEPEDLNAYTAGLKTEWLDRRLRINGEVYWYDYKNIQVQNVIPGGTILVNGGAATIKGAELEIQAQPIRALNLTASFAYSHGRYDTFNNGPTFFPQAPNAPRPLNGCLAAYPVSTSPLAQGACNLSGNKTIQTPPFTMNLSGTYRIPSDIGNFDLGASWALGGNYYFEPDNNPATKQGRTNIVNASVMWTSLGKGLTARLWANNLTKQKYYSYIAQSTSAGAKYSPAAPRTYGVTLGFNY